MAALPSLAQNGCLLQPVRGQSSLFVHREGHFFSMAAPRARTTPILCTLELAMRTVDIAALAAAAWIHRYPAAVTTSAWLPVCEPPSFSHPASPTPQMPRLPGQLEGTTVTKKVVPRPQVVRKHHLWPFATTGEASAPVSRPSDTPCSGHPIVLTLVRTAFGICPNTPTTILIAPLGAKLS